MIRARICQKIRHQCSGLGHPLFVSGFRVKGVDHLRVLVVVGGVVSSIPSDGGDTGTAGVVSTFRTIGTRC